MPDMPSIEARIEAVRAARHSAARSTALAVLATSLAAVGMGEQAVAIAGRALAAADDADDDRLRATAREVAGNVLRGLGASRAARRELRHAAALRRRTGDRPALKHLAGEIAHAYRLEAATLHAAGWPDQARRGWARALRCYRVALRREASLDDDATLWCAIAECEYRLGRFVECKASAHRALVRGVASPEATAAARHWECQALRAAGDLAGAVRANALARLAAEQLEDPAWLVQCLHTAARLEDLHGRFESASDLERSARELAAGRREREAELRALILPLLQRLDAPPAPRAVRAA